ncbi:MAG: conserved membrane protein of unknown function [Promethearchaeota archaeon]|nr:MAG: conserved membrane protein of unknown function [Candidatus Lokiarchaeota archaeon]
MIEVLLVKVVFPLVLLASLLLILISGLFKRKELREKSQDMMSLDEFIRDWLKDHGQAHKLEEQFAQMKKDPAGALYMPITYKGAKICVNMGLTPNKVSLINLILSAFIFWGTLMASQGHTLDIYNQQPFYGSWYFLLAFVVLFTGIIDGIDGGMARLLDIKSKRGAWFDNVIDRISDILMLVGLIPTQLLSLPDLGTDFSWIVWTNIFIIFLYEYMRARHEGLGLHETKPFVGERVTRIAIHSTFFIVYGSTSFAVFITELISPGTSSSLWSFTHPGVIAWSMVIFQITLLIVMSISAIQLGRYSYKNLKKMDQTND